MNKNANTITLNEQELRAYGRALGESLEPGTVLALVGDLGTGKTTLTKAIAEGLGIEEYVTSPTFTLINEYTGGRLPLYHFDVYRIDDPDEMNVLGYEEYFYGDGLTVVEWADKIWELLPEDARIIELSYGENESERILRERIAE
jgi:tRNA threonylcarbamoyladenosine biosynthesis protein TsaE